MKNQNLFAALRAAFPADLDQVAVETQDDLRYSWRDLERSTAMMANLLQALQLPAGARMAGPSSWARWRWHGEVGAVPCGGDVIRLATECVDPGPTQGDLLALADAGREAGRPRAASGAAAAVGVRSEAETSGTIEIGRRRHLRILRDR